MADEHHEIVIIKHRSDGDHDEHHGGVWKVAFADFMTAMMAFFLVMWLISANDKSKASIAKYFNPLKLVDQTQQPKGVHSQESDKSGITTVDRRSKPTPDAKDQTAKANPNAKVENFTETALFQDPYAVLGQIAGETGVAKDQGAQTAKPDGARGNGAMGLSGGEAFRDPFSPSAAPVPEQAALDPDDDIPPPPAGERTPTAAAPAAATQGPPPAAAQPAAAASPAAASAAPAAGAGAPPPRTAAATAAAPKMPSTAAARAAEQALKQAEAQLQAQAKAAALAKAQSLASTAADIKAQLDTAFGSDHGSPNAPKLEVQASGEGILISLTDDADFEMFPSASAVPDAKVVKMMEKLAKILKTRPGKIIIRGHTDGVPFNSATYDNWRLSSARAHVAHYMLVRGGLDEKRIERIEGYADRHLKVPGRPDAPENRRIEILLEEDKT